MCVEPRRGGDVRVSVLSGKGLSLVRALRSWTLARDSPVLTGLFANAASELSSLCAATLVFAMFQITYSRLDFLARVSSPLLRSACGSFPCPERLPAAPAPGADPAALEEGVAVLLTELENAKLAIIEIAGAQE